MATFLYFCEKHKEFEIEHSIKEKVETCPKCKEEDNKTVPIKRLIAGKTSFSLIGGSWAKDNYK